MKIKYTAILFIFLAGCVHIPQNVVQVGKIKFKFPQNVSMENLEFRLEGTNIICSIKKFSSTNNPIVLSAAAEGQNKLLETSLNGAANIVGKMAEDTAKGMTGKP